MNDPIETKQPKLTAPTVLIIDDKDCVISSTRRYFKGKGIPIIGAGNLKDGLTLLATHPIRVVLLDLSLPDVDSLEGFHRIRREFPSVRVILLSAYATVPVTVECMRHGAYDVFGKPSDAGLIANSVKAALEVSLPVTAKDSDEDFDAILERCESFAGSEWELTPRLLLVLRLVAIGKTNKQIGEHLGCAETTVETGMSQLLARSGCTTRTELVAKFWMMGMRELMKMFGGGRSRNQRSS